MAANSDKLIRRPAVAGTFYPGNRSKLEAFLQNSVFETDLPDDLKKSTITGGILPHAGYIYSGMHTASFFNVLRALGCKYDTVVILHPNHSGSGPHVSVDGHSSWETPLGMVEVDNELSKTLGFPESVIAQKYEHSAETIVPFIKFFLDSYTSLLSVNMLNQSIDTARFVAKSLFNAVKKSGKKVLVIASSDFTHFATPEEADKEDSMAVEQICGKNTEHFSKIVKDRRMSVCGYGPIMTLMEYTKMINESYKVKILSKGHSGETTPSLSVVSYISFLFYYE